MSLRGVPHRGLLMVLTAALVVSTIAYLIVRSSSEDGDSVATAEDLETTTTEPSTTTTRRATTTTTSTTTTVPPTTAGPTTTRPAARPAPPPPTTAPAPPFQSSIEGVSAEELGASWNPDLGCTPPEQLRALDLSHWGYDGQVHVGRIIVEAPYAERIVTVFRDIYAARFPIERMVPIAAYDGDDQASMRANNTSGYNCRTVADSENLSQHAYGRAIDVNPLVNPWVNGSRVDPPEGAPWADRSRNDPGMIKAGDAVVQAFARQGWGWGGYWSSGKDYQHFSATGT